MNLFNKKEIANSNERAFFGKLLDECNNQLSLLFPDSKILCCLQTKPVSQSAIVIYFDKHHELAIVHVDYFRGGIGSKYIATITSIIKWVNGWTKEEHKQGKSTLPIFDNVYKQPSELSKEICVLLEPFLFEELLRRATSASQDHYWIPE